jgi:RNA 3'-terminal phosphate cyclase-like protein
MKFAPKTKSPVCEARCRLYWTAAWSDTARIDYEVSFLRLCERISNGTTVEISYTGPSRPLPALPFTARSGTSVLFTPGTLQGGTHIHQCPLTRSVGWYLEPLLAIAPFCKKELIITLKGITTDDRDASVCLTRVFFAPSDACA